MSERAGWGASWLWLVLTVVCVVGASDAQASLIYIYTDERGNFVATDSLANVPPKFRARVTVREFRDSEPAAPETPKSESAYPSLPQIKADRLADWVMGSLTIPGVTGSLSLALIAGGIVVMLVMGGMVLTRNPLLKLVLRGVLILMVSSAFVVYLTYLMGAMGFDGQPAPAGGKPASPGGVVQKARDSARAQEAAQQQRARIIESLEQSEPAPR